MQKGKRFLFCGRFFTTYNQNSIPRSGFKPFYFKAFLAFSASLAYEFRVPFDRPRRFRWSKTFASPGARILGQRFHRFQWMRWVAGAWKNRQTSAFSLQRAIRLVEDQRQDPQNLDELCGARPGHKKRQWKNEIDAYGTAFLLYTVYEQECTFHVERSDV